MVKQHKPLSSLNKKRELRNEKLELRIKKINTDMKKYILSIILGAALLFTANKLSAQPGFDDDVTDTPIDGGIALVLVAGAAFGAKKIKALKD
jgi:hypothetical protein